RRHTRSKRDWSSDVCSSDLEGESIVNREINDQSFLSVKKGTVLLNEENQLVIMLNDHQSLSSYPQLGTIASYHIDKLAQKKQGRSEERRVGKERRRKSWADD